MVKILILSQLIALPLLLSSSQLLQPARSVGVTAHAGFWLLPETLENKRCMIDNIPRYSDAFVIVPLSLPLFDSLKIHCKLRGRRDEQPKYADALLWFHWMMPAGTCSFPDPSLFYRGMHLTYSVIDNILEDMGRRNEALPEYSNAFLMIPLDNASQGSAILKCQLADVINALLQPRLLDAASVCEDGRSLFSQIHIQAGVPA